MLIVFNSFCFIFNLIWNSISVFKSYNEKFAWLYVQSPLAYLRTLCPQKNRVNKWEIVKTREVPNIPTVMAIFNIASN